MRVYFRTGTAKLKSPSSLPLISRMSRKEMDLNLYGGYESQSNVSKANGNSLFLPSGQQNNQPPVLPPMSDTIGNPGSSSSIGYGGYPANLGYQDRQGSSLAFQGQKIQEQTLGQQGLQIQSLSNMLNSLLGIQGPGLQGLPGHGTPISRTRPRMRVNKACDRCRTQKIKCTGTHPCSTCDKHKKECTYSTTPSISKKDELHPYEQKIDDHISKKQKLVWEYEQFGLPIIEKNKDHAYVNHLENRIQYLESLLTQNLTSNFKQPGSKEPEICDVDSLLISPSSKWRFLRRHQTILIVELCKSMYESLPELSKKEVKIPRTQYFGWNLSGCHYVNADELPDLPEISNDTETEMFLDYFFNEINPLFAVLHETVFREQVQSYNKLVNEQLTLKKSVNARDSKTNQTRLFTAILYLVYVLSIRFTEMQKPDGPSIELLKLEESLFKYSFRVISILSFQWESFELIQSWLLIALYLRIAHGQTSSYHALGQAICMTRSMGLGQNNPKFSVATKYEWLKAERIFWCVYTFDRLFGLQTGRYCGIREEDIMRPFPSLEFKEASEHDDWITMPSFAMLHLARISNFIHTSVDDRPDLVKVQQANKELVIISQWFNNNGFKNNDIFSDDANPEWQGSDTVKVQVKLHYYDLLMCIHGKLLFNFVGRRISGQGLRIEQVLTACHGVIEMLDKTNIAGKLFTPWYMSILLLFNVGTASITLMHGGNYIEEAREILKGSIRLFSVFKDASVKNGEGKVIIKERFKMVNECLWALKMANRILTLRLQEDLKTLTSVGIDHGSSDVNKQVFTQLGLMSETREGTSLELEMNKDGFNELLEKQLHRSDRPKPKGLSENSTPSSYDLIMEQSGGDGSDDLLGNLQWFDQWLDFKYDF